MNWLSEERERAEKRTLSRALETGSLTEWLAEHDAKTILEYEKRRTAKVVIENIDGESASFFTKQLEDDIREKIALEIEKEKPLWLGFDDLSPQVILDIAAGVARGGKARTRVLDTLRQRCYSRDNTNT